MPIPKRLLIISPHPDDSSITASGLIFRTLSEGGEVQIVGLTMGDSKNIAAYRYVHARGFHLSDINAVNYGYFRFQEDRQANEEIGIGANRIIHLGFPGTYLWEMLSRYQKNDPRPVKSKYTHHDSVPYEGVYKPGLAQTGENLIQALSEIMINVRPDTLVAMHPNDHHTDHQASWEFARLAMERSGLPKDQVQVFTMIECFFENLPIGLHPDRRLTGPDVKIPSPTRWFELNLTPEELERKIRLVYLYPSQFAGEFPFTTDPKQFTSHSYLFGYVTQNEVYGQVEQTVYDPKFSRNILKREMKKRVKGFFTNLWHEIWD